MCSVRAATGQTEQPFKRNHRIEQHCTYLPYVLFCHLCFAAALFFFLFRPVYIVLFRVDTTALCIV